MGYSVQEMVVHCCRVLAGTSLAYNQRDVSLDYGTSLLVASPIGHVHAEAQNIYAEPTAACHHLSSKSSMKG